MSRRFVSTAANWNGPGASTADGEQHDLYDELVVRVSSRRMMIHRPRPIATGSNRAPTARLPRTAAFALFIAALLGCSARPESHPRSQPAPQSGPADVAETPPAALAKFARLVGDGWRVTFANGSSAYHSWHWGPGRHSLRRMAAASDDASQWAGDVLYWHPGRKEVCLLSLHGDIPAVGRGVSHGTMTFEGETANGVFDLFQPRGPRKMGSRWVFKGPDEYHDTLLEDTGAGIQPMNEWRFFRVKEWPEPLPHSDAGGALRPSEHLRVFEAFLGCTWEAQGETTAGNAFHIQTTYTWVPSVEVVCARVVSPLQTGESTRLFDLYFYHHVGTNTLNCLALSSSGDVYEGELTVLDRGALQAELTGYQGGHEARTVVRADFEQDGALRARVWAVNGTERSLIVDVHFNPLDPP